MRKLALLLLILSLSLYAQSSSVVLQNASKLMKSGNKIDVFRAYNSYKNLYLQSIINANLSLKHSSLLGIVTSGNILHIDVLKYKKELAKLPKKRSLARRMVKKAKKTSLQLKTTNRLQKHNWIGNKLIFKFTKPLKKGQVEHFMLSSLKNKKYKYIFDIESCVLSRSQNIRAKNINRVRVAQYKIDKVRIVLEHAQTLIISSSIKQNSLILEIKQKKNVSKIYKTVQVKKYSPKRLDKNKVIVIDAGHGGKDPGAVGYRKYREKDVVLRVAHFVKEKLKARGFKVYMTRERDTFVKLGSRTKFANRKHADIFLSIHANSVGRKNAKKAHGLESYFLSKSRSSRAKKVAAKENSADLSNMDYYGKESFLNTLNSSNIVAANKLAIDVQRGMLGTLSKSYSKIHDGGVREGPFWVLVGAQMPSVLVEVGFISHPMEALRLTKISYQKKLAQGIANGVERYFLNN